MAALAACDGLRPSDARRSLACVAWRLPALILTALFVAATVWKPRAAVVLVLGIGAVVVGVFFLNEATVAYRDARRRTAR